MGVKLSGVRELDRALAEMKKSTARGVLKRVAMKALQPIAEAAQRFAPVDDGYLRDSIVVSDKLNDSASRDAPKLARGERATGITVYCGTTNRNGVPREFGTVRTAAQPFLRPAWHGGQDRVLKDVQQMLGEEIEKTAARAAKRKKE